MSFWQSVGIIIELVYDKNQKVIEKLFDIVEKCTQRIVHLENNL